VLTVGLLKYPVMIVFLQKGAVERTAKAPLSKWSPKKNGNNHVLMQKLRNYARAMKAAMQKCFPHFIPAAPF
jgi:hypothetical protein